jgi:hypothetical protein
MPDPAVSSLLFKLLKFAHIQPYHLLGHWRLTSRFLGLEVEQRMDVTLCLHRRLLFGPVSPRI